MPPSHHLPLSHFGLSLSPFTTSRIRKPSVSAFTLKGIYMQQSVWSVAPVILCSNAPILFTSDAVIKPLVWLYYLYIYIYLYIVNICIGIECHSNQTMFAFVWFDSSCDSAAIALCTVINSGFSNQWLWLCVVCQINVTLWCCFYFIYHVPLCPLLYFPPQTKQRENVFPVSHF